MQPRPLTVTELTNRIKGLLENSFDSVLVQGEISNLARPSSGHVYFNLKDQQSQIAGVMFRSTVQRTRFALENGLEVLLRGRVTVYEPRGAYQLIVDRLDPVGVGALQLAFEQLKTRLEKEGLFTAAHKKPLPFIPRGIGLVTSPSGAAIHDLLSILKRRFPSIPILINPVAVQGDRAAPEIARAIGQLAELPELDLIIVARGGGSIEDLWPFNEEIVARAIFACPIPVISAVGHETDFTIADFVADLRAPTPSAAAELAVPLWSDLADRVLETCQRLETNVRRGIQCRDDRLRAMQQRLRSPLWMIQSTLLRLDDLTDTLRRVMRHRLLQQRNRWEHLQESLRWRAPSDSIREKSGRIRELERRLRYGTSNCLVQQRHRLEEHVQKLHALSPLRVLERGYAAVTDRSGLRVVSVNQLQPADPFRLHLQDGVVEAEVKQKTIKNR